MKPDFSGVVRFNCSTWVSNKNLTERIEDAFYPIPKLIKHPISHGLLYDSILLELFGVLSFIEKVGPQESIVPKRTLPHIDR